MFLGSHAELCELCLKLTLSYDTGFRFPSCLKLHDHEAIIGLYCCTL
jgi:hypothetical protein